jgi:diacylglycerol kinase family enzyme
VRTAVVINPTRFSDLDRERADLCAALAAVGCPDPLWRETTEDDPGQAATRDVVAAGVEVVLACGGDGTIRACADALAGTPIALAVLPAGTGNLLAANLSLPSDVDSIVKAVAGGRRRAIDLGQLDSGEHFAVMAGMGFDAAMMESTWESWKRGLGWPAYVIGGARRIFDRPMRVRIRIDGGPPLRRTARTVLVANVGRLQGGIDLFGGATPDDGRLDIAIIKPPGFGGWIALLASAALHRPPPRRHVESFRASTVEVISETVEPREVDGDTIEPGRHLRASIRPHALQVCVP